MAAAWALALAGCQANDVYGATAHGAASGRGSGTAGPSGAAATSGTTGSSGGVTSTASGVASTGSGSSNSSGGGAATTTGGCPAPVMTLSDCDGGLLELRTQLETFGAGTNTDYDKTITFYDLASSAQLSSSNDCGVVYICGNVDQVIAVAFQAPSSLKEIVADVQLTRSVYEKDVPVIPTLANSVFESMLNNVVADDPEVFVGVAAVSGVCPLNGWTFALELPDGGPIVAEPVYLSGTAFNLQPPTDSIGVALFFNIDPTIQFFTVQATLDPQVEADAGLAPGTCVPDGGAYYQLTGQARMQPDSLTFFPIAVP